MVGVGRFTAFPFVATECVRTWYYKAVRTEKQALVPWYQGTVAGDGRHP